MGQRETEYENWVDRVSLTGRNNMSWGEGRHRPWIIFDVFFYISNTCFLVVSVPIAVRSSPNCCLYIIISRSQLPVFTSSRPAAKKLCSYVFFPGLSSQVRVWCVMPLFGAHHNMGAEIFVFFTSSWLVLNWPSLPFFVLSPTPTKRVIPFLQPCIGVKNIQFCWLHTSAKYFGPPVFSSYSQLK